MKHIIGKSDRISNIKIKVDVLNSNHSDFMRHKLVTKAVIKIWISVNNYSKTNELKNHKNKKCIKIQIVMALVKFSYTQSKAICPYYN